MNVKEQLDQRIGSLKGNLENFSQDLRQSGRQVWLAGLGAMSVVDEQGRAFFGEGIGELVEKGEARRRRLENDARQAFEKVGSKVKQLGRKIETRTSSRVESTLERLGVPTSSQIQQLIDRVEQLNTKVEKLAVG